MKKFMRTHPHQPHQPHLDGYTHPTHTNGHANGVAGAGGGGGGGGRAAAAVCRDEPRSTLSSQGRGRSRCRSGASSADSEGEPGARAGALSLWEDDTFPPQRALTKRLANNVVWMRPYELCARPTFRGAGVSSEHEHEHETDDERAARWSVEVGAVGSAALCDACAALALTPRLLARLVPHHSFRQHYTGAFRFTFWVFGAWREVVVDDRLPTRRTTGRLLASTSHLADDFTLPLLEKAYAKLYGGYSAVRNVDLCQALQDVSGGVVQSFSLRATPPALTLQVLHSAVPRSTLLVAGAHVLSGLAQVRTPPPAAATLVRLRAASGRRVGSGAWTPGSVQWRALSAPDRDLLDQRTLNYGEFWMSFVEFTRCFSTLVLVHVGPDDWLLEPTLQARRPWRAVLARRRWRDGYNAGGPPPPPATTTTTTRASRSPAGANPQFQVSVPPAAGAKCHVVVSVTQHYSPGAPPRALHAVGFAVYELPSTAAAAPAPATRHYDLHALRLLDVTHCSRAREVVTFFTLPAGGGGGGAGAGGGQYLVVPHTQRAHTEAAFLLRILTDEHTHVWEVNEDNTLAHDVSSEFVEEGEPVPMGVLVSAARLVRVPASAVGAVGAVGAGGELEVRPAGLRAALRRAGVCGVSGVEVTRALVALRDGRVCGSLPARDVPALVALVARWRAAYVSEVRARCGAQCGARWWREGGGEVSSYRTRAVLRRAGVSCSNKVVEGVVARYSRRRSLSLEHFVTALAHLHLAHDRYRSLDSKLKSNPLSLEEMILMTIYS